MAKSTEQNRAIIYTRVSSKEQLEGFSLGTQERCCRDYAGRLGYDIDQVFVERGESAKNANRTELHNMLKYIAKNWRQVDAVIVYKVDRLTRNTVDHAELKVFFARYHVQLLSATEHLDATPIGRFNENQLAGMAQLDNEIRTERCTEGMAAAAASGRAVCHAPLGYVNATSKSGPSLLLGPPETVRLIRKAFELIDAGFSQAQALAQVTKEGLRGTKGQKIARNGFRKMLSRKTYMGYVKWRDICVRGDFEAIVPEDLFMRVQPHLHRSPAARKVTYRRDNPDFPLRGLVTCPKCGHLLTASNSKGHGGVYGYYACSKCKGGGVRKEVLEKKFIHLMDGLSLDPKMTQLLKIGVDANLDSQKKSGETELRRIKTRTDALRLQQRGIAVKNVEGTIPDRVAKQMLSDNELEMDQLNAQMSGVGASILTTEEVINTGFAVLNDLGAFWRKSQLETKQGVQRFLFPEGITLHGSSFRTSATALCIQEKKLSKMALATMVAAGGFEPSTLRV